MKLVIFDWKWTLYHPPSGELLPGAKELLEHLHAKDFKLVIIGKDQGGDMHDIVEKLGVRKYFHDIEFIATKKTPELFDKYIKTLLPEEVWVVGDRIKGEIGVGKRINAKTVWLKAGKFAHEEPESVDEQPDYTCTSLHDILHLFSGHTQTETAETA